MRRAEDTGVDRHRASGAHPGRPRAGERGAGRRGGAAEHWLDGDAGPVVRPYAVTGGRVRPRTGGFDLLAFVVAQPSPGPLPPDLQPEHRALHAATRCPTSVAELSAALDLPLGVVRVLLGDLLAAGLICLHEPPGAAHLPDEHVLKAVVNGLRGR